MHARFVTRLWQDLRHGELGADYVASSIAQLDNTSGDIDTLQGRIASIRSWAYIAQRPDWVRARDEMAARARGVEARLSDALHARLTERFVNRRTAILMKRLGADAGLLAVRLEDDDVLVEGELIGSFEGLRFAVDPLARHADRKLLLAAAERHVPALLCQRALALAQAIAEGSCELALDGQALRWQDMPLANLSRGKSALRPALAHDPSLVLLAGHPRDALIAALEDWLTRQLAPLAALRTLEQASLASKAGPELRALLIRLVEAGGVMERAGSRLELLDKDQRAYLAKLGVRVSALDIYVPAMLKGAAQMAWALLLEMGGKKRPDCAATMIPVLACGDKRRLPFGYRLLGTQAIRLDLADKLLREAHAVRVLAGNQLFSLDPAKAISTGLKPDSYAHLLRLAGFRSVIPQRLPAGMQGPPAPSRWRWRSPRAQRPERERPVAPIPAGSPFAALAELVR